MTGRPEAKIVAIGSVAILSSLLMTVCSAPLEKRSAHSVNCSRIGFPNIPCAVTPYTEILDLSHNQMTRIQQQYFKTLSKLKRLILSFNKIAAIEPGAFANNSELQHLDLSNNSLHDIAILPFNHLKSLTYLDISNNLYDTIYLGVEIKELKKLETLMLGTPSVSFLKVGSLSMLRGLPLQKVHLITQDLEEYEPGTLTALENLRDLILDLHIEKKPDILTQILNDLPNTTTTLEIINYNLAKYRTMEMHLSNINIDSIGKWDIEIISSQQINLHKIYINNIVNPNFFKFYSLKYIQNLFQQLTKLSVINGSMYYIPCGVSEKLINLKYLDVSFNLLQEFSFIPKCSNPFPGLTSLVLNDNKFSHLRQLSVMTFQMRNLTRLIATSNSLQLPGEGMCSWSRSLRHINFSHNKLLANVFSCLPSSLESVDLSYNAISTVPNLEKMSNLREIILTGNAISFLPEFAAGHPVRVLSIDRNAINTIDVDLLRSMNQIQLKLGNNPFRCSCAIQSVIDYIEHSHIEIIDWPADYRCASPLNIQGQVIKDLKFSTVECNIPLFVGVLLACIALVVALCVILCIKYKVTWYIHTLWLWVNAKRHPDDLMEGNFEYHAFISYSERDSDWVKNKMLPQLETNNPPFHICIHERDFRPGKSIIANIIDCISKSYKTIFVLSKSFVQSEWCHYELFFAHNQILDKKKDSLILLLLEPIPAKSIPDRFCKLRKLMNRKTYLEWPQGEFQQNFFWKRLKAILNTNFQPQCLQNNPAIEHGLFLLVSWPIIPQIKLVIHFISSWLPRLSTNMEFIHYCKSCEGL
uniref:Toll-like receptor 2 n=1 Tax=Callorhinchus milii TaxID=7868 RepID=A0A4W3JW36_CALMI